MPRPSTHAARPVRRALAAALALVLLSATAQAQSGSPCSTGLGLGSPSSGTPLALTYQQSFTAPCTGYLASMTFSFYNGADDLRSSGYFVVFSLKDAAGTTTLATTTPTDQVYPNSTRTVDFSASRVLLTAGTQYRWEAQEVAPGQTPVTLYLFPRTTTDLYAGGQLYLDGATNAAYDARGWTMNIAATQAALYNPTSAQGDGAGYRLLGAPATGYTVGALAGLNLVQGVPAGANAAAFPAQYPLAGHNVFPTYLGGGSGIANYPRPTGTDAVLAPGRGFYWYLYDRNITPGSTAFGGGTSQSRELTGVGLATFGTPLTANVQAVFADNAGAGADNFQMLANPFERPLAVSGITATGGTIQGGDVFYAYNPSGNGFVTLTGAARLAVWQGVLAELVPTAAGSAVTVTYAFASTDTNAPPTFYGKGADATAAPEVRFALAGTLAGGAHVTDDAALVRLVDGAEAGWDALDASKPTPPGADYALVAPMIERGGTLYALGVDSRPPGLPATVPLALTATAAGTFTLSWTAALPEGWTATLADTQTGALVNLTSATELPFTTSGAVAASERFVLMLRPVGATAGEGDAPETLTLTAARPNPTTGTSSLVLSLPEASAVRVAVYDVLGREVAVLVEGQQSAGDVTVRVAAGTLAAGTYVVRATVGAQTLTQRLTVTR